MKKKNNGVDKIEGKRFTIIDFLICLIIISAVAYVGVRFFNSEISNEMTKVEYQLEIVLPQDKAEVYKIGDFVLSSDGEAVIGEIVNVSSSPATMKNFDITVKTESEFNSDDSLSEFSEDLSVENENFESSILSEDISVANSESAISIESEEESIFTEINVDGYVKVVVTVSAQIKFSSDSFYVNGEQLKIGLNTELTTKSFSSVGKCISISEN